MRKPVDRNNCGVAAACAVLTVGFGLIVGCASPGPPLPPSLKLPQIPADLTATRVGSHVVLHWTTPARTTDRMLVTGPVTAEVCREAAAAAGSPPTGRRAPRRARSTGCNVVARVQVSPGASQAEDSLPPAMTAGAPAVLGYRVQLLNGAGRTAGPTTPVYAPAGRAPEPVTDLRATSTKPGVVLEWTHPTGTHEPGQGDSVELDRVLLTPENAKPTATGAKQDVLLGSPEDHVESRFSARDTGGAIDRTAQAGKTYRYTVQRVRQVPFQGKTLQIQSESSAPVEIAVQTVFPPDTPANLLAAPGYTELGKPAIDLSWEPNVELHVAGYKVYRRSKAEPWRVLTQTPVRVAAYRDAEVTAGEGYTYRVTAINDAGMESPPSAEVSETAPSR